MIQITIKERYDKDESLRDLQRMLRDAERAECRRLGLPLPVGGGTTFTGAECLASLNGASLPAAVANTVAESSLLTRDVVGPFAPTYWGNPRSQLRMLAFGIISTTGTPTILLKIKQNTAYANPIAGAILAGSNKNAALTTGTGLANANWALDVLMSVNANGQAGSILCAGRLTSEIVSATDTTRWVTNATPPTAVAEDLTLNQYVDLTATWGTASASNTIKLIDYLLESIY